MVRSSQTAIVLNLYADPTNRCLLTSLASRGLRNHNASSDEVAEKYALWHRGSEAAFDVGSLTRTHLLLTLAKWGEPHMDPVAAKFLGAGLSAVGIGLSAVGFGVVYAMASEKVKITGLLLTAGFGASCLLLSFLLLFVV